MWVTPRSNARWMARIDSASSTRPPVVYMPAMVMAPRPIRETSSPPRLTCFMTVFLSLVSSSQGHPEEHEGEPVYRGKASDPLYVVSCRSFEGVDSRGDIREFLTTRRAR